MNMPFSMYRAIYCIFVALGVFSFNACAFQVSPSKSTVGRFAPLADRDIVPTLQWAFHHAQQGNDFTSLKVSFQLEDSPPPSQSSLFTKAGRVFTFPFRRAARLFRRAPRLLDGKRASKSFVSSLRKSFHSIVVQEAPPEEPVELASSVAETVEVPTVTAIATEVLPTEEEVTSAVETKGDRWAVAAPKVEFSGTWNIIVTDEFKQEYEKYLTMLGQPFLVRSVALSIVGMTTEDFEMKDKGKTLYIHGRNVRGVWERTLTASGAEGAQRKFTPLREKIITADDEHVEAEAWWESKGTVHRSWLRGVKKYGGGDFESKRYLENNGKILVCESTFHPKDKSREKAKVTWRFQRG